MTIDTPATQLALNRLGFDRDRDFYRNPAVMESLSERNAIRSAFANMGVVGLFAPRSHLAGGASRHFPILYVVEAADIAEANAAHRSIWSQSLVPLIMFVLPDGVQVRNGFNPKDGIGTIVSWKEFEAHEVPAALTGVTSIALRSSLSWQNFATARMSRVDTRLYHLIRTINERIRETSEALANEKAIANSLIGRMLYLFVLVDRGIIRQADIDKLKDRDGNPLCPNIDVRTDKELTRKAWPAEQFWKLMDVVDEAFNGTIFPLSSADRRLLGNEAVNTCRDLLRKDDPTVAGPTQAGLFDVDYAALRTETVSTIYEQFFAVEDEKRKTSDGAFYTPAYLVDYVLDEMDGIAPFSRESIVCDPAAGSGAFLVSAFRRIVERERKQCIDADELREVLTKSIHGLERNPQAANVARFSLYLTMLDYLPDVTLSEMLERTRQGECPLFPSLEQNVLCEDFFTILPSKLSGATTHVIGNPPWTRFADDTPAQDYYDELQADRRVAYRNLAELFAWRAMEELLSERGTLAFVMSARSFIGSKVGETSFPSAFAGHYRLHGLTNLSHFRRKLFEKAGEPAIVIFSSKEAVTPLDMTWRYAPLLTSQPLDKRGTPWSIVVDRGSVERSRQSDLIGDARDWFHNVMLGPLDRIYARRIEECEHTLGSFMNRYGISIDRGGQDRETGLRSEVHLGTSTGPKNYLVSLGIKEGAERSYTLTASDVQKAREPFRTMFGGDVILMPRSNARYDYFAGPVAFNSSINGMYFKRRPSEASVPAEVLREIAAFLNSRVTTYLKALVGKAWILESRRLEASDLRRLPFPFESIGDLLVQRPSRMTEDELVDLTARNCGLGASFGEAARDYADLRAGFQNGKVPAQAVKPATVNLRKNYRAMVEATLRALLGEPFVVRTDWGQQGAEGGELFVSIATQTEPPDSVQWPTREPGDLAESTSLRLVTAGDTTFCRLSKPALAATWTLDRAYLDARMIVREAVHA